MNKLNLPPFYVGQKVVCVDSKFKKNSMLNGGPAAELIEGEIYTVQQTYPPLIDEWGIVVNEVKSSHPSGAFLASRFAPIQENLQSISLEKVLETETPLIGVN